MVTRSRMRRSGNNSALKKERLPKTKLEVYLEKKISEKINPKHRENLKKVADAVKEVGKTSAWVLREGGKALGDLISLKYYDDAMKAMKEPKEEKKIAEGMEFKKTYEKPLTTVKVIVEEPKKEDVKIKEV